MSQDSIKMCGITKIFNKIKACEDVNLEIKYGEIHALLGENGAGKSTLMSILNGLYLPDSGYIKKKDKIIEIKNPRDANKFGFGMVYQHFKLVKNFTALENIILGFEKIKYGFLDNRTAKKEIDAICENYDFKINLNKKVYKMSVSEQQKVEILKLLYRNNSVLVFDEATAVLMPHEINSLLLILKKLAEKNKAVLFITHRLNEIKSIAKKCSIMRNGKLIECVEVDETDENKLSRLMMGKSIDLNIYKKDIKINKKNNPQNIILKIDKLSSKSIKDISFELSQNEIIGIAGIDGNGQQELVNLLTGIDKNISGEILYKNKTSLLKMGIFKRNKLISFIPEDRHKFGLVLDYTVAKNLILKKYFEKNFKNNYFIDFNKINDFAKKLIKKYNIKTNSNSIEKTVTRNVSGGNQQKIIIARELELNREIIIAMQPTRGLDVGATKNVHDCLIQQRELNRCILLISLDIDEILTLSDRILVLYQKKIVAELDPKETSRTELGLYMSGTKQRK